MKNLPPLKSQAVVKSDRDISTITLSIYPPGTQVGSNMNAPPPTKKGIDPEERVISNETAMVVYEPPQNPNAPDPEERILLPPIAAPKTLYNSRGARDPEERILA